MYKVGEFSKMTGLSKEALRYYSDIKLLEPVYINPDNNYRYYDNGSYIVAMLLVQLRRFDFTIQEMKSVIEDESFANLENILREKKRKIEEEIQELSSKVDDIDEFLRIGNEGD
ncbi:MerR family DNA-binding transcriptional regulator [Fictibacillus aquaticus]|uniref:Transcriptional regulator n=1 Tax=Fictibacillus aquaticus TaxID=2021314 RepID=A0A235F6F4_9BACL|nr:MerR family DNA-binding transcriptional regulator [Fictibacillus aquaticus]OYD56653.1 transcriptional regulator [Fictibacillus aquaticus]